MTTQKQHSILAALLIIVLCISLLHIQPVLADGEAPPEPTTTEVPTEPPTATEVVTEPPVEAPPVAVEATATPIAEILTQAPESTEVVVLDESGSTVPLATEEAAAIIAANDPMWCPAGVLPGGAGCSASYGTIGDLINNMVSNTSGYTQNGVIYFTATADASFTLSPISLPGGDFDTLNDYNLTLQGGWDGSTVAPNISGQTNFSTFSVAIGTSSNPWVGNITLNDITFSAGSQSAVNIYTTTGNITLSNVDVTNQANGSANMALLNSTAGTITVENGSTFDGNAADSQGFAATTGTGSIIISDTTFSDAVAPGTGNNYQGATLSAPTVTLTNVTSTGNDGDGIVITNANLVTLNNLTSSNNGTQSGPKGLPGNDGSGVVITGVTLGGVAPAVVVNGGTFNNNAEYGVEITNPATTNLYIQNPPTCTGNVSNATVGCYNDTTVVDSTAPVITPIITGTAGSNGWYTSNVTVNWTATDAESGINSSTGCTTANLTAETSGVTLTCTATNNAGLSNSATVTIKIDKTAPSAALAISAGTQGSNGWYTSDVTVQTTGTESLSAPVVCTVDQFQTTDTAGTIFNGSCTNNAGLTTNAVPLTVKLDKTGPTAVLSVTAGTVGTNGWYTSDVTVHTAGADLSTPVICTADQFQTTETSGTVFNGSCTNNAGLTTNASPLTIQVDKTNPTINAVGQIPLANINGWNNSDVTVNWSCADALSGPVAASVSQTLTTEGAGQSATGICLDNAGNAASNTQNGIKIDKMVPVLTLSPDLIKEATGPTGAVVNYSVSASDNLTSPISVNCSPADGSLFNLGSTPVNCSSTDDAGNSSSGSFQITVVDTTDPVIASHLDLTVEATSAAGAIVNYVSPSTSDDVDGSGTASCSPTPGSTFALGNTTVGCSATDAHGNIATPTQFTIHVVDTTGPVLNLPGNITTTVTGLSGVVVTYSASSTDLVDGPVSVTCVPASGSTFPLGSNTVNCSATDAHANTSSDSFVINVQDASGPTITLPANITVEATSPSGAVVSYSASASDIEDGSRPVTCLPLSNSTFALGTTTVNCSASDLSNHTTTAAFLITVEDTTAPMIAAHADITVNTTSAAGGPVSYNSPSTSDLVDGAGLASCSPVSGSIFPVGDTQVVCSATDSHGNNAVSSTFIIHINQVTQPPASVPPSPQSTETSSSIIPLTGSLNSTCLRAIKKFDVRFVFHNLCDNQTIITSVNEDKLPEELPTGYSFLKGLDVRVLNQGLIVKSLPSRTGIQIVFSIPAGSQDQYAVLYWNDENGDGKGEWIEIAQSINSDTISQVIVADPEDELYHINLDPKDVDLYKIITTEKTGIFVLVKK